MESTVMIANIVFILAILAGVIMTIIGMPGNLIILLAGILYGYYDHFDKMDYAVLVIVLGIFVIAEIIEFIAGLVGAKKEKASKRAMFATFIGTIIGGIWGTAILPVIGSLLGALFGAFIATALAEYSKTKDLDQAKRVGKSVLKGQIIAIVIKSTAAVSMAIILLYQVNWH